MTGRISPFFPLQNYLFLFLLLFTSCAVRSVYIPTIGNEHLFNEKKQVQAKAFVGSNHVELLVGTNPIKHFSIGANVNVGNGLQIYEGLLGVYNYSKNEAKWRYELLLGANSSRNSLKQTSVWFNAFNEEKSSYVTESSYNKYFTQASFGYFGKMEIYKLNYSFSINCRFSHIVFEKYIYKELNADSTLITNSPIYIVNKEFYNKNLFLLEPCLTNKVGIKNVSAIMQLQCMIPYSSAIDIRNTKFSPVFIFSLGFQYTFIFKKKNVSPV